LEVENGAVTSHEGNYEDYLRWKEAQVGSAMAPEHATKSNSLEPAVNGNALASTIASDEAERAARDRPRRLNPIKQKQMEERCAFLEEEIPRIEGSIAHTEEQLGVYVSAQETQRLGDLAAELRSQLTSLTEEWEDLMAQLDGQGAIQ
jgi:ATP-binding cassette subfamily F protein 3